MKKELTDQQKKNQKGCMGCLIIVAAVFIIALIIGSISLNNKSPEEKKKDLYPQMTVLAEHAIEDYVNVDSFPNATKDWTFVDNSDGTTTLIGNISVSGVPEKQEASVRLILNEDDTYTVYFVQVGDKIYKQ